MKTTLKKSMVAILLLWPIAGFASKMLPDDFVYLRDVDPTIIQEIRYAGQHNFLGRPVEGYIAPVCILTRDAAMALHDVQAELKKSSLTLKVYDCYRPQAAVDDFIAWSQNPADQRMKAEFYPHVNKADVFKLGYVAEKSGHSRGSTVDLTIVPIPVPSQGRYLPDQPLVACTADYSERFQDNMLDMGTGYDCLDEKAHVDNKQISQQAQLNRSKLTKAMEKYGFVPYENEWWHFTYREETHPDTYYNFLVN